MASSEQWRQAPGFPGYEVSSAGSVRTWRPVGRYGKPREAPLVMSPKTNGRRGYKEVNLSTSSGRKMVGVHRLVATAFLGACPDGMEVCHNNGDPADNRVENLRFDTRVGNFGDKRAHGTHRVGSRVGTSKLTEADALFILRSDLPAKALAAKHKISKSEVRNIKRRLVWKHLKETA